jgi:hypothetical protein
MGFLSAYDGTHRVVIPHPDREYWVELKKHVSHGATEKSQLALQEMEIVNGKAMPAPNVFKSQAELVLASILDWNLDDDNGHVWPLNMQSIRRLPDSVFTLLHQAVLESNKAESPEERARFRQPSLSGDPHGDSGSPEPVDVPDGAAAVAAPWSEA